MLAYLSRPALLLVLSVALFAAVGIRAFTAANTVPVSDAGQGSGVVSGFTITNIDYNLNAATPSNVDTVTFTATAVSGSTNTSLTIRVLFDTGTAYYTCTRTGGAAPAHTISCDTDGTPGPQLTVVAIDTLDAIIVQQ